MNSLIKILSLVLFSILFSCENIQPNILDSFIWDVKKSNDKNSVIKEYKRKTKKDIQRFIISRQIGDINYSVAYIPTIKMLIDNNSDVDTSSLDETARQYNQSQQYIVRFNLVQGGGDIIKYKLSNQMEYQNRINFLANEFGNNIYLVQGKDTLRTKLYHFERIYGLNNYCSIMVQFKKVIDNENETIMIIEDGIFNGTIVKLRIPIKKIKKLGYL